MAMGGKRKRIWMGLRTTVSLATTMRRTLQHQL